MAETLSSEHVAFIDELKVWENQLQPYRDMWQEMWRKWMIWPKQHVDDAAIPYLSKTAVPYTFDHVETIVPRIVGATPAMTYRPIDDSADHLAAAIHSGLASWELERMGFKLELKRFGRQGCVTGYSVGKFAWVKSEADVAFTETGTEQDPMLDAEHTYHEHKTERRVVKNAPFFDTVNVLDFVFPIQAKNIAECSAVWQRVWKPLSYLRNLEDQGVYKNVDQVKAATIGRRYESRQGMYDVQGVSLRDSMREVNDPLAEVEVWERWEDERLIVIANPQESPVLLRDAENPFWHKRKPFVDWSPIPHPFLMPGIGIVQVLYDLNEDYNTQYRQRSDAVAFQTNPAFKGRGIDGNQLTLFPGMFLPVDDMQDIQPLFMPTVDMAAMERLMERTILDMQNLSGASSVLTGNVSDAGAAASTATGIQTTNSEANKRIDEMVDELAERAMKPIGYMLASMNTQFIEGSVAADFSSNPQAAAAWQQLQQAATPTALQRVARAIGVAKQEQAAPPEGLVQVDSDWLATKGRLEPIPHVGQDEEKNKIQKRSDATQAVNAIAPFLQMVPTPVSVKATLAWVLGQYDVPADEITAILDNKIEEQMAQLQQQLAQQQAAQSPSGPSGPGGDNLPTGGASGAPGVAGVYGGAAA